MNHRRLLVALVALTLVIAGCGFGTGQKSGGTFTTIYGQHAINAGLPINIFNSQGGNAYEGYNQMQLGYSAQDSTDPNKMLPGLAQKWQLASDGGKLTVTLQPNAKWSNGKPVTPKDVRTSFAIAFAYGNVQSYFVDQVNPVGDHQVEFLKLSGSQSPNFVRGILSQDIVPDEAWGPQLPANIWDTIQASLYSGTDAAKKAAATQASTDLTNLSKQLNTFGPSKDISAGPYVLKSLNSGQAVLEKNPNFYAADQVHPSKVVLLNYTGNQQIWNYLQAGRLDAAPYTAMPTNVLNQILKTKGNKEVSSKSQVAASLAFNQSIYPYGLLPVRQAMAYVLDRSAIQKVGEPVSGIVDTASDGMIEADDKAFLSAGTLGQLEHYDHNTDKATQLLQGAGFTKQGGKWMLPNGQPWTLTLWAVTGFSDWIEAASLIASELSDFGIATTTQNATDYAAFQADQKAGKYAVSFYLDALSRAGISAAYQRIYGPADGYVASGSQLTHTTKNNWINAPETADVPGVGTVNPGELTFQLGQTGDLAQQKAIVTKLALTVNKTLPVIELWDYVNVQFVNTVRWSSFPTTDAMLNNPPGVWMFNGFVQPAS